LAKSKTIVTGDKELDRKLASIPWGVQSKVARQAMRKAGYLIQAAAKGNLSRNQNVDTGQLQKGIKVRALKRSRSRVGISIATTAERAESGKRYGGMPLEAGTKHMTARPFLRPAGYDNEDKVRAMIVADVEKVLDGLKMRGMIDGKITAADIKGMLAE
jgi:HK97 gp10 family phage protein